MNHEYINKELKDSKYEQKELSMNKIRGKYTLPSTSQPFVIESLGTTVIRPSTFFMEKNREIPLV